MSFGRLAALAALFLVLVLAVTTLLPSSAAAAAAKSWTVMVYLDGDNNLDPWAQYTLDLMAQGLSSDADLSVVVLYDHAGAADDEKLLVTADGIQKLGSVPEPDMASPATLAAFVGWAMKAYPAERYVLDVWDHGYGWIKLCDDDSSGRSMSVDELAAGLTAGERIAGDRVDMVLFEACNMGEIEVTYELRDLTRVVVCTELTQDFEGVPWDTLMADLVAEPGMDEARLGKLMVDGLVWSYTHDNKHAKAIGTLACFRASRQASVVHALDHLSLALLAGMKRFKGAVGAAGSAAKNQLWCGGVSGIFWFDDAWVFADQIEKKIDDPTVDYWAGRVKATIAASLYENHTHVIDGKCHGVSISFPPNRSMYDMKNWAFTDYAGIGLDFTADTHWDEMLLAYYAASGNK